MAVKKRILLVEDDSHQAAAIQNVVSQVARRSGIEVEFVTVDSEFASLEYTSAGGEVFDLYIVDLMLPWCQDDEIPNADDYDPDIRAIGPGKGALFAGFRVVRRLKNKYHGDVLPPIVLNTIANGAELRDFANEPPETKYMPKAQNNNSLASEAVRLLRPSG